MNSLRSHQTCRGIAGFHCIKPRLIYQHKDAQPEKLGVRILNEFKKYEPFEFDYIEEKILELKAVPEHDAVQPKNKQQLIRQISEHRIGYKAITNYEIFRPLQGTLEPWMSGKVGFYPDGTDFVHDSYFCKWDYVANFDNQHFEILRGDQTVAPIRKLYGMEQWNT